MKRHPRGAIEVFEVLASTNDSILEAGAGPAPEGTTHIARSQTRGRGRAGHTWWSPAGAGLWMSTLLRPPRSRPQWGGISLVAGRAVRDALLDLGIGGVELYWPNDLQAPGGKIGGILGEARSSGGSSGNDVPGRGGWIALGIGLNIDLGLPGARESLPPEVRAIATSMAECGCPTTTDPVEIAGVILERFWPLYDRFRAGDPLPDIVGTGLAHRGREVEVRVAGTPPWRGIVEGLGGNGELIVRQLGGDGCSVMVTGGEVIYEDG